MRIWTEEAKQKQREAIRRWQPWKKSTGPRSWVGKKLVSRNACKGHTLAKSMRALRVLGARQKCLFRAMDENRIPVSDPVLRAKQTIMRAIIALELDNLVEDTKAWLFSLFRADNPDLCRLKILLILRDNPHLARHEEFAKWARL